jgi:hypothetical protein
VSNRFNAILGLLGGIGLLVAVDAFDLADPFSVRNVRACIVFLALIHNASWWYHRGYRQGAASQREAAVRFVERNVDAWNIKLAEQNQAARAVEFRPKGPPS